MNAAVAHTAIIAANTFHCGVFPGRFPCLRSRRFFLFNRLDSLADNDTPPFSLASESEEKAPEFRKSELVGLSRELTAITRRISFQFAEFTLRIKRRVPK